MCSQKCEESTELPHTLQEYGCFHPIKDIVMPPYQPDSDAMHIASYYRSIHGLERAAAVQAAAEGGAGGSSDTAQPQGLQQPRKVLFFFSGSVRWVWEGWVRVLVCNACIPSHGLHAAMR